jgi:hypothetical protein
MENASLDPSSAKFPLEYPRAQFVTADCIK